MINQETLDGLKNIGLNLYERKLYSTLLARGTATVGELSELASVPRSRAYDVLESLATKGFVIINNSKPLKFVVIPPQEAMKKTKKILRDDHEKDIEKINQFMKSESITKLNELYTKGVSLINPAELSGSFKGEYSMNMHLTTLVDNAKKSIDIITTEKGLETLYSNHEDTLKNAADKGIKIRIIAPITKGNEKITDAIKEFAEFKNTQENKNISGIPLGKMTLIDHEHTVFGLTDDKDTHSSQEVSFWTNSNHFTRNFAKNTFELIWKQLD